MKFDNTIVLVIQMGSKLVLVLCSVVCFFVYMQQIAQRSLVLLPLSFTGSVMHRVTTAYFFQHLRAGACFQSAAFQAVAFLVCISPQKGNEY